MKRVLLIGVLMLLGLPAFAIFQYEVVMGPFGSVGVAPGGEGIKGHPFSIRITEGTGSIYIADRIDDLKTMAGNKELLSITAEMSSTKHYGWADLGGKAVMATGKTQEIVLAKGEDGLIIRTGYELGQFSAGDQLGVWLTPNDQKFTGATIFDRTNPIISDELIYRDPFVGIDATGADYHELMFKGPGSVYFEIYGVEDIPSGQPLPGVLATLLVGGAISGAAGMKKRRGQKA